MTPHGTSRASSTSISGEIGRDAKLTGWDGPNVSASVFYVRPWHKAGIDFGDMFGSESKARAVRCYLKEFPVRINKFPVSDRREFHRQSLVSTGVGRAGFGQSRRNSLYFPVDQGNYQAETCSPPPLSAASKSRVFRLCVEACQTCLKKPQIEPLIGGGPPRETQGFVDASTGEMRLEHILVPVAHSPSPRLTLNVLTGLLMHLGVSPSTVRLIHVGDNPPDVPRGSTAETFAPMELIDGQVVETILRLARDQGMDMIVMPTAGHQGFLDALRGSTTERVLHQASCPVLAVRAF